MGAAGSVVVHTEVSMNDSILDGCMKQVKGRLRQQFGRFTDSDVESLKGKKDEIIGLVQERYGEARDEAAKRVDSFLSNLQDEGVLPSA